MRAVRNDGGRTYAPAENGTEAQYQAKVGTDEERGKPIAERRGGNSKFSIRELSDGRRYVKADRQVLFGSNQESWSEQLEDYINGKIRRGQDVRLIAEDGDILLLTQTSAGKLSDNHTSDGRTMSDTAFERKANAAAHIDELVEVSSRGANTITDQNARHGDMASKGWNYRTAYFMDFDGKYYKTTISVAQGADGSVIYNVGKMQERSALQIDGSSGKPGALRGNASGSSIRQSSGNSQEKNSGGTKFSLRDSTGRELTEAQQEYFKDSKVRDAEGNLLVMYHQTDGEFTVFDTKHKGAGSGDNETPFGIFLKKTARDIGIRGKKQMALYADIQNPLRVGTRAELVHKLRELSAEYAALKNEAAQLDKEYGQRFEVAKQTFVDFLTQWRKEHPDASSRAVYEAEGFDAAFNAEEEVLAEWTKKQDALAMKAKEAATAALREHGYDGVFLERDQGSWGRSTEAYIALDAAQVKNTDNRTPTKDPDIRFSLRESAEAERGRYLVPAKTSEAEIEKMKKTMDEELAEKLAHEQTGMSYRFYARKDGMSSWGHAMFADDVFSVASSYGGDNPKVFSVSETQLVDINDLKEKILSERKKDSWLLGDYKELSDEEFFEMFDPTDIVMSAGAYDNGELLTWLGDNILAPEEISGIKTYDGAVVFDPSIIVRNLPMEVYFGRSAEYEDGGDFTTKYSLREQFPSEIDRWNREGRPEGERFTLGSTGPVLQGLGAIESDIYMEGDKISTILREHPEMTLAEIKKIPQILEDPALVLKSKTRGSSIVVLGTYRAQNGKPILAAMNLQPRERRLVITDMQKVASAYTKTESENMTAEEKGRQFLKTSDVLFADKKRTATVLRRMGIQAPIGLLRNGYIGSISYKDGFVKTQGVPFSSVVKISETGEAAKSDAGLYGGDASGRGTADQGGVKEKLSLREARISDRELLANALEGVARNENERGLLSWYRKEAGRLRQLERYRDAAEQRLENHRTGVKKLDVPALRRAEESARRYATMVSQADEKLLKLEAMKPVREMVQREREYATQRLNGAAARCS